MAIFISYSHKDKDFVDTFAANLVKQNVRVWVDTWELNVGDSIIEKVQKAIEEADALLVILSQSSIRSDWCRKELSSGLIRELEEKRVVVLPVLIEDCEIPLFLKDKYRADFTVDKDEGLKQVLEAIAKVTSDTLRRIDKHESFIDFGLYTSLISGLVQIRLTLLEQVQNFRYSVITEIFVNCNKTATKRYQTFMDSGFEWFARQVIFEAINETVKEKDAGHILLDSSLPQNQHLVISDEKRGITHDINVESRRIGEDNGKDVLVNWGDQLQNITELMRKDCLRLPENTKRKLMELLGQLP